MGKRVSDNERSRLGQRFAELRRDIARKKPFLLGLIATVLTWQAAVLPILFVLFLFLPSDSPIRYNGVEQPLGEVRLRVLGMLLVWFVFAAYVGPGLLRGRAMARNAVFGAFVLGAILQLADTVVTYDGKSGLLVAVSFVVVESLIQCAFVGWYLYLKPNVRGFFDHESGQLADAA
jgi:hypothetical protein